MLFPHFSYTKGIVLDTPFCILLFSLNNMSWKLLFISYQKHSSLFFFFYSCIVLHPVYLLQFIQSLFYGHLNCFQSFITNDTTLNNFIFECWLVFMVVYLLEDSQKWDCYIKGKCMCYFVRYYQIPLHRGCIILPILQQCLRMLVSLVGTYYTLLMKHFIKMSK